MIEIIQNAFASIALFAGLVIVYAVIAIPLSVLVDCLIAKIKHHKRR